mmetsp:Transcript_13286/g.19827  ORF Transcript_13286/g.19827 Transcript_13286/m.19827 type:complete len:83 (+) Transcript_13286:591-839(+)
MANLKALHLKLFTMLIDVQFYICMKHLRRSNEEVFLRQHCIMLSLDFNVKLTPSSKNFGIFLLNISPFEKSSNRLTYDFDCF